MLFLLASFFPAFACMGGLDPSYKKYDEKPNYLGHVLCDYNESCNFISSMNKKYGAENWEYDENYYIEYPHIFENAWVVPPCACMPWSTIRTYLTLFVPIYIVHLCLSPSTSPSCLSPNTHCAIHCAYLLRC